MYFVILTAYPLILTWRNTLKNSSSEVKWSSEQSTYREQEEKSEGKAKQTEKKKFFRQVERERKKTKATLLSAFLCSRERGSPKPTSKARYQQKKRKKEKENALRQSERERRKKRDIKYKTRIVRRWWWVWWW